MYRVVGGKLGEEKKTPKPFIEWHLVFQPGGFAKGGLKPHGKNMETQRPSTKVLVFNDGGREGGGGGLSRKAGGYGAKGNPSKKAPISRVEKKLKERKGTKRFKTGSGGGRRKGEGVVKIFVTFLRAL